MADADSSAFYRRLGELGGPAERDRAAAVARTVVGALAAVVPVADRSLLTPALPAELRDAMRVHYAGPSLSRDDLVTRVAASARLKSGAALEQIEVVCRVLAERVETDPLARIRRHLPDELSPLLDPPRHGAAPVHAHAGGVERGAGRDRSLAGFRGDGHSLADGKPDKAQSGSVAKWDDSRDDHTLGAYSGDSDDDDLASGRPGSRRPLSGRRD